MIAGWINEINALVASIASDTGRGRGRAAVIMQSSGWLLVSIPSVFCPYEEGAYYCGAWYKRRMCDDISKATDAELVKWHAVMEEVERHVSDYADFCYKYPLK